MQDSTAEAAARSFMHADSCPPLVKWAGGKRLLLKHILPLIPPFQQYYEPFLGGGALFFALLPAKSLLSDKNPELINTFKQVRDNCEATIAALQKLRNEEGCYYRIREEQPHDPIERAARFLYLTRLAFNGIYRLNLDGRFNVPYGKKRHLDTCDSAHLRRASRALHSATIRLSDFENASARAKRGDLVYFDPPYTVAHGNNGFLKYNAKIFSWDDQIRLAGVARRLTNRGVHVIVSNANHPSISDLYDGFRSLLVSRYSVMSASAEYRRKIQECLFYGSELITKGLEAKSPKGNSLTLAHH